MSDGTTVWITSEQKRKLDKMVDVLSARVGLAVSRSSVMGRAIDSLFLQLCPPERENDDLSGQEGAE